MVHSNKKQVFAILTLMLLAYADAFDATNNESPFEIKSENHKYRYLKSEKVKKSKSEKVTKSDKESKSKKAPKSASAKAEDDVKGRFVITRPSVLQPGTPASTPLNGGIPLAYANTQYNPNFTRPVDRPGSTQNSSDGSLSSIPRPGTSPAESGLSSTSTRPYESSGVSLPVSRPGIRLTESPTREPSSTPSKNPTPGPTKYPTPYPTHVPSKFPTKLPTHIPTATTAPPTPVPTKVPTPGPTDSTRSPSKSPTPLPTPEPTPEPTTALDGLIRQTGLTSGGLNGLNGLSQPRTMAPTAKISSLPSDGPSMEPSLSMAPTSSLVPSSVPSKAEVIAVPDTTDASVPVPVEVSTESAVEDVDEATAADTTQGVAEDSAIESFVYPTFSPTTWKPTITFQPTILFPWEKPGFTWPSATSNDEDEQGAQTTETAEERTDINRGSSFGSDPTPAPIWQTQYTPGNSFIQRPGTNVGGTGASITSALRDPSPGPTLRQSRAPISSGVSLPVSRPGNGITESPTGEPSSTPSKNPTPGPTKYPTPYPTHVPSKFPTKLPTHIPTATTAPPTPVPTKVPTPGPTESTKSPSKYPTPLPTPEPTPEPTPTIEGLIRRPGVTSGGFGGEQFSSLPSDGPSLEPSIVPTVSPTTSLSPSSEPTVLRGN